MSEKALRELLAEAADYTRHPDYDWPVEFSRRVSEALAQPAQPEQEPVAWLYSNKAGYVVLHITQSVGNTVPCISEDRLKADEKAAQEFPESHAFTPLYAAPAVPLTDEQIKSMKPVCADFVSFRAGVRAVEYMLAAAPEVKP